MPAADAVLLPLCIGLSLIGVLVVVVAGRRGRRGRALQGLALALAPVALYFSGLLRLLWDAVVAVVGWASRVVLTPSVWIGLSLLAVCVVLWVVGGLVARRAPRAGRAAPAPAAKGTSSSAAVTRGPAPAARGTEPATKQAARQGKAGPPVDDDMAEIEALLKSRGID